MSIKVGNDKQIPPKPQNWQSCGSYFNKIEERADKKQNEQNKPSKQELNMSNMSNMPKAMNSCFLLYITLYIFLII